MQHAAYIDDIAAIIGNAVDVVAEFALPLIEPGVFAGVMYVAAEHPAMRGVAMVVKHNWVVAQNEIISIVIDFSITADARKVVHHI